VLATESVHPYVAAWWPPGHTIGYEHGFHHAVVDFVRAVTAGAEVRPNFEDGLRTTLVLEAALRSAASGTRVEVEAV
jgi:predicted dehydrogenase